jgi:UDP-N-acetylmuramate--alanine ligase
VSDVSAADRDRALALLATALKRRFSPSPPPSRALIVDVGRQRLYLVERGEAVASYTVSTSAAGIGGEADSNKTPPGWHLVHARIGDRAPEGAVFESREPTGRIWRGEPEERDLILTRVLTLAGLEEGVNRGPGHDSLERYIYIHGTNHERDLGRPASHGCVRMSNADVLALFDRVREHDPVVIVPGEDTRVA